MEHKYDKNAMEKVAEEMGLGLDTNPDYDAAKQRARNLFDIEYQLVSVYGNISLYRILEDTEDINSVIRTSDEVSVYYLCLYLDGHYVYITDVAPIDTDNIIGIIYSYNKIGDDHLNTAIPLGEGIVDLNQCMSFDDYLTAIEEFESSEVTEEKEY